MTYVSLDQAHEAGEKLTEQSSAKEVLEALEVYKKACWPDGRPLYRGTLAWLIADFFPRWIFSNDLENERVRQMLRDRINEPFPTEG